MLLITLRDLRWRARRFLLGMVATSLVFTITLVLLGVHAGFLAESTRAVHMFDADAWVVPAGVSGPFTAAAPISDSQRARLASTPGVRATTGVALYRDVAKTGTSSQHIVNVIGYQPGSFVHPPVVQGRQPRGLDEAMVDERFGGHIGEHLLLGTHRLIIVGITHGVTYLAGTPALFQTLAAARQIAFAGAPLDTAILTRGIPRGPLPGLKVMSPDAVISDLRLPLAAATTTIGVLALILALVAAGVVGLMAYLSGLDRLGDFAVYKAVGVRTGKLALSMVFQVLFLAVGSALVAAAVSLVIKPAIPIGVVLDATSYLALFGVALVVSLCASLVSIRQATSVDPALAFGRL